MKPSFRIIANAADITAQIADRLLSISITDEAGIKSDRLELHIDDRDQRLTLPDTGAELRVSIGYLPVLRDMGTFVVDEVEVSGAPRTLSIRASAVDFNGTIAAPKERSWHDTTLGAIFQKIAKENNLTARIDSDIAKIKIEHEDQTESDMQFITRLATENNALAKVADKKLVVNKRSPDQTQSGKAIAALTVLGRDVTDWSATLQNRAGYTGVTAYYNDKGKANKYGVTVGDKTKVMELAHTYANEGAAKRAAKSKLSSLKNSKRVFTIQSMPGDVRLSAELKLNAIGFRAGVDGVWLIKRVEHSISGSGYTTSVECESPDGSKETNALKDN